MLAIAFPCMGNIDSKLVPCGPPDAHESSNDKMVDDNEEGEPQEPPPPLVATTPPPQSDVNVSVRVANAKRYPSWDAGTVIRGPSVTGVLRPRTGSKGPPLNNPTLDQIPIKSCLKKDLIRASSHPHIAFGEEKENRKDNWRIRFDEKTVMVRIDSHKCLSKLERLNTYYNHEDMKNFVRRELSRRAKYGIKSMSALAPESETIGELDDPITS